MFSINNTGTFILRQMEIPDPTFLDEWVDFYLFIFFFFEGGGGGSGG